MHPAQTSRASDRRVRAPDRPEHDELSLAWVEVVAAFEEASTARVHELVSAIAARGRSAALVGAAWGGLVICVLVAWTCAHVALGLWLASRHGAVFATAMIAAIHGGAAPLLFTLIRLREMNGRSSPRSSARGALP